MKGPAEAVPFGTLWRDSWMCCSAAEKATTRTEATLGVVNAELGAIAETKIRIDDPMVAVRACPADIADDRMIPK